MSPWVSNIFNSPIWLFRNLNLCAIAEMQKFIGSLFFAWDEELRCPITGEIPICNSSDLNEELGQVSFISYFHFKTSI
jgi:hypothetical protein